MSNDAEDLFDVAKRLAMHVTQADDPCDAMMEFVKAMADEAVPGDDMLKILTGAVIFMAKTLDMAAKSTVGALVPLLVLLYPGKPVEELFVMAAAMLRSPEERATRHVFVFQRRGE